MPLLGAIGNASQQSFRGNYDNYPFDIDFGNLIDAEPGQVYFSQVKFVDDINYKVPVSISGDGKYRISNVTSYIKTFDSTKISFDQTGSTFDYIKVYFGGEIGTYIKNENTLDNDIITLDQTSLTLDISYDLAFFTDQPSYIRNGNAIGLRILGVPPKIIDNNITIIDRSSAEYTIPLNSPITIETRDGDYTFNPGNSIQVDDRTFQGDEVGIEYYDKTYSTTVTIGKREFTWTVNTKKAESPQGLSFTDQTDVDYSTEIISDLYTVQGLNGLIEYTAEIISNEGTLSVNYEPFTKSSVVSNNDILRLKTTSSNLNNIPKTISVRIALTDSPTVGQATTSWTVTTIDSVPDNTFDFAVPSPLELNSEILSDIVTLSGVSSGVDFTVSTSELLSVNGEAFVKSSKVNEGDKIQLKIQSSSEWLEDKTYTVSLSYKGSVKANYTYANKNRSIVANSDDNADKLIFALPLQNINETEDMSPDVRVKSGLAAGLQANAFPTVIAGRTSPSISTEQSKFYGDIGSLQIPKGTSTTQFKATTLKVVTDSSQSLGYSNFTIEMWVYLSGFNFNGQTGISLFYPNYLDNKKSNDYFFQLYLKGDNWVNSSGYKRGILLGFPNAAGTAVDTLTETTSQVLVQNSWNHIAVTRQGNLFRIFVNGILRGSGSRSVDLTSSSYTTILNNFQVLLSEDVYIQDFRMYKGVAKYTSNFNTLNVTSIMEKYKNSGNLYEDAQGRILILSCTTKLKDPRTLSKVTDQVLPGTDTCIDDTRWQEFLSLAQSTSGYRLAVTEDQSTAKIINATSNNIQRMLNGNVLTLRNSLTSWQETSGGLYLAWDEDSGSNTTGLDYSLLNWEPTQGGGGFGYYGYSANPFFTNPTVAYFYQTANWWILPPGVPDF